jgi:hypothetical protein
MAVDEHLEAIKSRGNPVAPPSVEQLMGRFRLVLVLLVMASAACSSTAAPSGSTAVGPTTSTRATPTEPTGTTAPPSPVATPRFVDENGFDDHSVPKVDTVAEVFALSKTAVGGETVMKFVIPDFDQPASSPELQRVHLMDSNFFQLHDQWFYFRLLNGQRVPNDDTEPFTKRRFATIAEIYSWALAQPRDQLPLDLRFDDNPEDRRLFSSAFYKLALDREPRVLGVGSIVHLPETDPNRADRWLLELEYSDIVTPERIANYFDRLTPVLPAEIAEQLQWVVRSPHQQAVAEQMADQRLAYFERVVRYGDIVPAGTVAVYNQGISAGRLLYVGDDGAQFADARSGDIVISQSVPDWLPPASALITGDPQTPLAHVNLLARNRGIPNASQVGITDDPGIRQAARVRAYAIVIADGAELTVALISADQYQQWVAQRQPRPTAVSPVDISTMPVMLRLDDLLSDLRNDGDLSETDLETWRPIIGGKSAGMLALLDVDGVAPPPDPIAITVKPYVEHLAPLRATIEVAIADPSLAKSARARWLILEGDEDYAEQFPSDADAAFATDFTARFPKGTAFGELMAAGGIRNAVADRPVNPATLRAITEELADAYSDYDVATGLRFRSSSSVEDIDGFNGAGLYTSHTGYLRPDLQADVDDRDNTIERALQRPWGSYWSFEAFEERRAAGVDHLSGAMGLTVHARFDDDLEFNNGVATFTFLRSQSTDDPDAVLEVNVQQGSTSVTNPYSDGTFESPEVVRVLRQRGQLTIERVGASTLVSDGAQVLSDDALRQLFEQTEATAAEWRTRVNAELETEQALETIVLDFEFKTMAAGWPARAVESDPYPERLVLRQVRSLDPGLGRLPLDALSLPIPRDVLRRASEIRVTTCNDDVNPTDVRVFTDTLLAPDLGYAETPLVVTTGSTNGSSCVETMVYASPDRSLRELVASGDALVISGRG